jgi:diguanylate cyclase (GGDEF)-like protein/PAS domain S-box-containing protein
MEIGQKHCNRNGLRAVLSLVFFIFSLGTAWSAPRDIRVGVYDNEPKIFPDSNGNATGILGDLLREIAKHEGWALVFVRCEWLACLESLKSGDIDLMPDVAFSEQRSIDFNFHKTPALLSWSQIYKRNGLPINSTLDLGGKRIVVLDGSVQQAYLSDLINGFGLSAQFIAVKSLKGGFEMVSKGEADVVAASSFFGDMQAPNFQLESTPILFNPVRLFYATGKGRNADLLEAIDATLDSWIGQKDSPYATVLNRWTQRTGKVYVPNFVLWSIGGLLTLSLVLLAAAQYLRREVAKKTRNLQASEDKLSTILNSVDAYIYIKDTELRYQYVNRKVSELFGKPIADILGQTDQLFFDTKTAASLQANDLKVIRDGVRIEVEEVNRSANSEADFTFLSVKLPLRTADGKIYALCGISTDITRRKNAEFELEKLSQIDSLTGLENRRHFMELADQELNRTVRYGGKLSVLMMDLDHFKAVNDTYGHQTGDRVLRQLGELCRQELREIDIVGRYGGEEFACVLPETGLDSALEVAERFCKSVAATTLPMEQGLPLQVTISIGVASLTVSTPNLDTLLSNADQALYDAKHQGRNRVCVLDH